MNPNDGQLRHNIISKSEAIRIATEADNITVAELPGRKPIVKQRSSNGLPQFTDNSPSQAISSRTKERSFAEKDTSDLQVSIVSSTDFSSSASKKLASSVGVAEKSSNADHFKCDICGRTLSSKSFQNHMNVHYAKNRHVCPTCGKSYAWPASLTDHLKATICGSMITSEIRNHSSESEALPSFVDVNTNKDVVTCARDSNVTERKTSQSETESRVVGGKVLENNGSPPQYDIHQIGFPVCNQSDAAQKDSNIEGGIKPRNTNVLHPIKVEEDFMYPCVDCGQPFKNEDLMWKHFEVSHCVLGQSSPTSTVRIGPRPVRKHHECPVCHKILTSSLCLKEHLSKHTGAKNFSCPTCGRLFAWRGSVRKHLLRTSCGDGIKRPSPSSSAKQSPAPAKRLKAASKIKHVKPTLIKNHNIPHNAVNPSEGIISGNVDSSKIDQRRNVSEPKSRKRKIPHASELLEAKRHFVIVEEFVRNTILFHEGYGVKEDMQGLLDVGDAPEIGRHVCSVCSNVYKYKSSLKIHMRCHTGERPYQCKICKERFGAHRYCRKHVLTHGLQSESEVIRNAVKKKMESDQEEKGKKSINNSIKSGRQFSGSTTATTKKEACGIVQERKVKREKLPHVEGNQKGVKTKAPRTSVESAEEARKPSLGNGTKPFMGVAYGPGEGDTSGTELKSQRETRKRNVKYFDLEEDPDDEVLMKRKKKNISKVVEDSLGMNDFDEQETYQQEFFFKKTKNSKRNRGRSLVTEVVKMNGSFEPDLSNVDNSLSLQNHTSVSSSPKKEDCSEDKDGLKLLFQCKICNTKFSSRFVLRRHEVISGHTKASYECPYCKRIYSEGGAYTNHMYVHQRENGMNCDICGKELQSRTTFMNHMEMHRRNPFHCDLCFEWFPTPKKLQEHLDVAHDNQKEFKCKYCKKTFDWQSNYARHMNKHTKRKEFKCKICHYSFNIISNLKRHMTSVHKGESELTKSTWEALNPAQVDHVLNRQHQRRDLWEVKEEDSYDYSSTERRRGRLKASRAENRKKYTCEICEFLCSSRMELTNHVRFGHKEDNNPDTALIYFIIEDENFVCQLCGSVIFVRHSLKNHMRRVHNLEIDDSNIAGVSKYRRAPKQNIKEDANIEEGGTVLKETARERITRKSAKSLCKNRGYPDKSEFVEETKGSKFRPTSTVSSRDDVEDDIDVEGNSSDTKDDVAFNEEKTVEKVNCGLCNDTFESQQLLVHHLNKFHKIPAGLERSLIALTKDVPDSNCDPRGSSKAFKGERGKR